MEEEHTDDPTITTCHQNDVNKSCNDLYKLKEKKNNEREENEKTPFVINVNLLNNNHNNNNNNTVATNTLKSDFFNSTLQSPNLVKNNNRKNIESVLAKNIFDQKVHLDNGSSNEIVDPTAKSTDTIIVHSETLPKPLKGILKNSPSQSPVRKHISVDNLKNTSQTLTKQSSTATEEKSSVDEIHSRLIESQCKISQLQNSLPTKLNSATIDAIKLNYSPIKNLIRQSSFQTKIELNKTEGNCEPEIKDITVANNINSVSFSGEDTEIETVSIDKTDKTSEISNETGSFESLEDELSPDKLDAYARFIKEFTMSEDNGKKKKRSNSFRKIFPAKLFGLKDKTKTSDVKRDGIASTSATQKSIASDVPSGNFNRNSRERHTFTNFSCKTYSNSERRSLEPRHEDYPLSAWECRPSYVKEDEYSLPIDACIRNDKKYSNKKVGGKKTPLSNIIKNHPPQAGEDYVCMNSNLPTSSPATTTPDISDHVIATVNASTYVNIDNDLIKENSPAYFYEKTDENSSIRKKSNSISSGSQTNKDAIDISQDRHVLIETKAVIPLNTERALPNPYHKNNNVIPESMILEPMYINVNNKKQDQTWNDGILEQNLDTQKSLVEQIEKQKNLQKIFNLETNYEMKISNSPYETIFGNVRPPQGGRIPTRSLSPEQRYKMDVKTPSCPAGKMRNIDDSSRASSTSPVHKSFNNDCCLKSSPKKELNSKESSPKSPIAKLKSNKNENKKKKNNKNDTNELEFSHQNLEIPIDYPEINLNNASKHSPKKQLYENFAYLEPQKNSEIALNETKIEENIDLKSLNNNINSSKNESFKSSESCDQSDKLPEFVETPAALYQNSPSNITNKNESVHKRSQQQLARISPLVASHSANSSPLNSSPITLQNLYISEQQIGFPPKDVNKQNPNNNNQRLSQPSPSRMSPAIISHSSNSSPVNYPRMPLDNTYRQSSVSPQKLCNNSSPINYNTPRAVQNYPIPQNIRASPTSPQKLRNLQNVEAFYWKKISEIKEREQMNHMYFNPQSQHPPQMNTPQMSQSFYGNSIIDTRQSRSRDVSCHQPAAPQNRGRRSLSLPRNIRPEKPNNNTHTNQMYSREEPTKFYPNNPQYREGNTSGYGYTSVQQGPPTSQLPPLDPNFNRRTPQRSTISAINYNPKNRTPQPGDAIYENYVPGVQFRHQAQAVNKSSEQPYAPIFRRGSLQQHSQEEVYIAGSGQKKVSFLSAAQSVSQTNEQSSPPAWPTKNGYVQSPPTRRNNRSESVGSDSVFISGTPTNALSTCDRTQVFFPNNQEFLSPIYGRTAQNQQIIPAPMYGQDIYGQAIYGKTAQIPMSDIYGEAPQNNQNAIYGRTSSTLYGKTSTPQPRQVIVRNKVCDMYGQIHEPSDDANKNGQIYGQIKKSGILYGELKAANNGSPTPHANGGLQVMNRLQQRALPSPPQHQQAPSMVVPRSATYAYNVNNSNTQQMNQLSASQQIPSESESGSEAGEVQRIMQNSQHIEIKNQPIPEEEWNADGKSGRGHSGNESGGVNSDGELRGSRSGRSARREDPRRHTLSGDQHLYQPGGAPGGILRTMDLESSLPRGYPPPNAMLFDDDPGIMSEVETSSTGFRRGGKQRSSLPVVRTPSKTLERPLGLVFLQYRNETKRALLPNEITSIDTVKALFVRSFPKQLTMEYLDSPLVKIYIHDSSKDMFYELEDLRYRSHLRDIRDRSVLRLFESTDISGGLPVAGQGISGGVGHFEDQSYFSEPEFDSEYQHQHIHKSKSSAKAAPPYYLASTNSTLPRGGPLLRTYSPAIGGAPPIPADRIKSLPGQTDRMRTDGYMSSPERSTRGQYEDPYYSQFAPRSGSITPVIDEEASDTELLDDSYSLYGAKIPSGGPRAVPAPRSQFPTPAAVPYDTTRIRVEHMERQLANLTGLVQKALTQAPPTPRDFLIPPGRDSFRSGDEFDKNSSSSSTSLPDDSYLRSDTKTPKLGKSGCHKSVSFEKSVSFSDEPPDMNSPKQHSPQHTADTKPPKPAIKSSTLPRTSSQERDRLKPAPPPKPAALAVQYDSSRHLYRDLQLTPEMYNQLRGLQKKAKDLRAEVRNLRRMSQAQAHSVRETIRDTFIKIRTMLLVGGEQAWQAGMDQERVRLSREEDLYKQEMIRLEKDLSDLESTVEELRGNVINRKTRVNMSDVENMALILSKSSKTVADLKVRFPSLQEGLKGMLTTEMEKVVREEKFLKEEPERLESALRRCKKLTGTLVTLKRLASVQEQRLPCPGNPTGDGRLSPSTDETPPVTPTSAQHGKPNSNIPTSRPNVGPGGIGGDSIDSESSQRPENALDALLDELQTFSRPHNTAPPTSHVPQQPPAHAPTMAEIGRKGSMDSHALTVSTGSGTGSLRRLHSYPSGSDTDNSPPIQPAPRAANMGVKPPLPERNAELLQALAGRRVPPPPPPRTSSRSPLASPTSPGIPPRNNTPSTLQHIQNVQNMAQNINTNETTTQSQFDAARENLGLGGGTLRRNVPGRSSLKERSQTLPRNIGSNLQVHTQHATEIDNNMMMLTASNSSSCESVNSQEGAKKGNRQEQLEMRHQELLKKQKALQEQYARLQQLQRGNNALTVVPPTPDILLKKTGSESNILQKMGLNMMTASPQINTGSLTHLANNNGNLSIVPVSTTVTNENTLVSTGASTTSKVYETDIL